MESNTVCLSLDSYHKFQKLQKKEDLTSEYWKKLCFDIKQELANYRKDNIKFSAQIVRFVDGIPIFTYTVYNDGELTQIHKELEIAKKQLTKIPKWIKWIYNL